MFLFSLSLSLLFFLSLYLYLHQLTHLTLPSRGYRLPGCGRPVAVPWVLMPGRMVSASPRQTSTAHPHVVYSKIQHNNKKT